MRQFTDVESLQAHIASKATVAGCISHASVVAWSASCAQWSFNDATVEGDVLKLNFAFGSSHIQVRNSDREPGRLVVNIEREDGSFLSLAYTSEDHAPARIVRWDGKVLRTYMLNISTEEAARCLLV